MLTLYIYTITLLKQLKFLPFFEQKKNIKDSDFGFHENEMRLIVLRVLMYSNDG